MSCDSNARLFSRVRAGISGMSSKQAFAAGAVAGAAGTGLAAAIFAQRRRIARRFSGGRQGPSMVTRAPQKPTPKPLPGLAASTAIRQKPKPVPGLVGGPPPPKKPKPIPGLRQAPLPALSNPPETKLQAAPVLIQDSAGRKTTLKDSFRVLRGDGSDTGLSITPYQAGANGGSQTQWGIIHAAGGTLIDGPFNSPQAAQQLAAKLAPLRWSREQVSATDVNRARAIVKEHHAMQGGP